MPESIPPSGHVHWAGTGLSTGSGLRVLADRAGRLTLWGRTKAKAAARLTGLGLADRATAAEFAPAALGAVLGRGDVVVSMLPASEHAGLLAMCTDKGAHFACTSYVSPAISAAAFAAGRAGVVVLTEAGLDPGIDHLLAHRLVAEGLAAAGGAPSVASFTSYCGGLPAEPNEFRYRFSWAPLGVLSALCQPAVYIEGGEQVQAAHPWQATRRQRVNGEVFEVYPNRDSIPFVVQYGIPPDWHLDTFVRGTLRLDGWSQAWSGVFAELLDPDPGRLGRLAKELAARYPSTATDLDRVVLAVTLSLRGDGGGEWSAGYLLDLTGDREESAMARCVSLPLAFGVAEILNGRMAPGLHRAARDALEAERWLAFLDRHGIHTAPCQG
jgi:hypothetical protein